jgi:hypothetical protein
MADQQIIEAVKGLSQKIESLNFNLSTTQIANFDGDSKTYERWIKGIEKHAMLEGIPIEKVVYLAFKTSTGAVSDLIPRYLKVNPRAEWDALKAELAKRFADVSDAQHAFTLLRQIKQERNENIQVYVEHLLSLAEEAFEDTQDARVTEGQLIGFFTNGLYSDRLKIKVMKDDPKTLQKAINSARDEFKLQQRFQLRMGRHYFAPLSNIGDPMEVDHYRYQRMRRYDDGRQRPKQIHDIIDDEDLN